VGETVAGNWGRGPHLSSPVATTTVLTALWLASCWASHGNDADAVPADASGTQSSDALVRDGRLPLFNDGSIDAATDARASGPPGFGSCIAFNSIWIRQRERACRACVVAAGEATCSAPPFVETVDGCGPAYACAERNCLCERPGGVGDCANGQTDDVCGCIDSCLVPGASPCRDEWNAWMSCIVSACADTCGL